MVCSICYSSLLMIFLSIRSGRSPRQSRHSCGYDGITSILGRGFATPPRSPRHRARRWRRLLQRRSSRPSDFPSQRSDQENPCWAPGNENWSTLLQSEKIKNSAWTGIEFTGPTDCKRTRDKAVRQPCGNFTNRDGGAKATEISQADNADVTCAHCSQQRHDQSV